MNVSNPVDGVSHDRRMLLSKRYFSGPIHPVGKEEDIQYELQESQNVQIPKPAPLMGTLPLTLLNPALGSLTNFLSSILMRKDELLFSQFWTGL